MKTIDKILLSVMAVVFTFGLWNVAMSGNITASGIFQGDLYTFLSNTVTMCNELKSDHNTVMGSYSTARTANNTIGTDHNVLLVSYSTLRVADATMRSQINALWVNFSTLNERAGRTGGFASITGTQKLVAGDNRVAASGDATNLSTARATTATDSTVISGGRTTTTDLTLSGL